MSKIERLIRKNTEFLLVIVGACALSIGFVMGPRLLNSILEKPSLAPSPERVSDNEISRTLPPVIRSIPLKRVQPIQKPAARATKIAVPKPVTPKLETTQPRFYRMLYSVAQGTRMHGEDVRRLQIRLMILAGVDPRKGGDGWFGPRTAHGLKKFQMANGLPATGIANFKTWQTLFSSRAKRFEF
jgi:Putative peptidoglycan binding domain